MGTNIKTWQISDGKISPIDTTMTKEGRKEADDLESWIESNPSIINPDFVLIGRQVTTKSGPLDLLAIDRAGNLIIIELKREMLPRDALAQALDYASDVADWTVDKIDEVCEAYTNQSLESILSEKFPDENLENMQINGTQRIFLVGFGIESALERMINWLSSNYNVPINAMILNYIKTAGGDELLTQTMIISEEIELERTSKKKFQIPMSDEPGNYDENELLKELTNYLSKDMYSARRLRDVFLPVCLENEVTTRDQMKAAFVTRGEAADQSNAGYFLSLISNQIGMKKNDFLRQVIGYSYPNYGWEKDNYHIKDEYRQIVETLLKP